MVDSHSHAADPVIPVRPGAKPSGPAPGGWRPELVLFWLLAGSCLVILHLALVLLSPHLDYGSLRPAGSILVLVGIEVAAGAVYLAVVWRMPSLEADRSLLIWILAVGLILRLVMLGSTPMLGSDYYRYLWDGAVTAHGFSPYRYSPQAVMAGTAAPEVLRGLALEAGPVLAHIQHPTLHSLYAPLAQAVFAVAHWLYPWSVTALRLVLLAFDLATLVLLALVLRTLQLPLAALAIYWWNPLLIREVINSCQMDILALPLVVGAMWFVLKVRPAAALSALAGGVGMAIWPLALLPLTIRAATARLKRLALGLVLFVLLLGVFCLPVYLAGWGVFSGFWAYARGGEMNDALFRLLEWGTGLVLHGLGVIHLTAPDLTRMLVLALLAAWAIGWAYRPVADGRDFARRSLFVLAAMFFLSPVQAPWYFIWLLPFLVLQPRRALLLLTPLLPLYYLRYFFLGRGQVEVFDYGIVWLEYLPVWILLFWEVWASSRPAGQLEAERERV